MDTVLQEIIELATVRVREALTRQGSGPEEWDPDAWEGRVGEFTRQIGHELIQAWGEEGAKRAEAEGRECGCGRRRQVNKRKQMWWLSTFGRVEVVEPYLVCPGCGQSEWPAPYGAKVSEQVSEAAASAYGLWCRKGLWGGG